MYKLLQIVISLQPTELSLWTSFYGIFKNSYIYIYIYIYIYLTSVFCFYSLCYSAISLSSSLHCSLFKTSFDWATHNHPHPKKKENPFSFEVTPSLFSVFHINFSFLVYIPSSVFLNFHTKVPFSGGFPCKNLNKFHRIHV